MWGTMARWHNPQFRVMVALLVWGVGGSAYGVNANYDQGRVGFFGKVSDVSCSVSLGGANDGGYANVMLAPVSLAEIHQYGAGAYLKPQPFTLHLSHCRLGTDNAPTGERLTRNVNVRWVDGYVVQPVNNENAGYLANTRPDGARHISLALAVNNNNTLDKSNKIVPADPLQNTVMIRPNAANGGEFTYYIGYVTQTPGQVTSGPVVSHATWELIYH